jgi:hypothetical protein
MLAKRAATMRTGLRLIGRVTLKRLVAKRLAECAPSMHKRGQRLSHAGGGMKLLTCTVVMTCALLTACGPSEQKRAELAEKRRIECLDTFCEGDVEPPRDKVREVALKLNGQWYVGPKAYFARGSGAVLYWPGKEPGYGPPGDFPPGVKGRDFYDVAIEVFLSRPRTPNINSTYQELLAEQARGRVLDKRRVRDGLEAWRTQFGNVEETWFIATDLRLPTGEPPVIACRGNDPAQHRCTSGFLWTPEVAASVRFRATHGPDWPDIYLEIHRVLQQLRRI